MSEAQERIIKLCDELKESLLKLDNSLEQLRVLITNLQPEDQDSRILGAFNNILDCLSGIVESKYFSSISDINGFKDYTR